MAAASIMNIDAKRHNSKIKGKKTRRNVESVLMACRRSPARRYTMLVLSDLGDGEKVGEQIILNWVNTTLGQNHKDSQISSFKVREMWLDFQDKDQ